MELNQIKDELSQVEQVIGRAAKAIRKDKAASQELKDCVDELTGQSKLARDLDDAERLTEFIEDMEATSIRAMDACAKSGKVGAPVKDAVLLARRQLTVLNNQLVG
jgi:hypothetical protein